MNDFTRVILRLFLQLLKTSFYFTDDSGNTIMKGHSLEKGDMEKQPASTSYLISVLYNFLTSWREKWWESFANTSAQHELWAHCWYFYVWGKSGLSDTLNMKQTTLQLCNLILPPANSDFFFNFNSNIMRHLFTSHFLVSKNPPKSKNHQSNCWHF